MLLCIIICMVSSKKYAEYQLWKNYGQVFFDFSSNQRHAINGIEDFPESKDCISTDRGLYLQNTSSHFNIPKKIVSGIVEHIPIPYQVVFWFNMESSFGLLAYRNTLTSSWYLNYELLDISMTYKNIQMNSLISGSGSFTQTQKWNFYNIKVYTHQVKVFINNFHMIDLFFNETHEEKDNLVESGVGSNLDGEFSVIGFLWYYALLIEDDNSKYYHNGYSNNCLTGGSCSCNFAFKLGSLVGCMSESTDINLNTKGEICSYSKCNGGILKDCECSSSSCYFEIKTECECIDSKPSIKEICICLDGLSCCNEGCSACEGPNFCTKCTDSNARVNDDKFCECESGYIGNNPLSNGDVCESCNEDCFKCNQTNYCLECKYENQEAINGVCKCSEGFFLNSSHRCEKCDEGCLACNNSGYCEKCTDNKAVPTGKSCESCQTGYFMNNNLSCQSCPENCLNCIYNPITLIDINCIECKKDYEKVDNYCDPICRNNEKLKNHTCSCIKGSKKIKGECIMKYFELNLKIDSSNKVYLNFEKTLDSTFSTINFTIFTTIQSYSIELNEVSKRNYNLKFNFYESVKNGTSFILNFDEPLYSEDEYILKTSKYTQKFSEYEYIPEKIENMIETIKKSSKISNSIAILLSFIGNPSLAWLLISTLQIIYLMPLSEVSLTPAVNKFCKTVSQYNIIFNTFELFIDKNAVDPPFDPASKIGIESAVVLINIGSELTLLIILIIVWPFLKILSFYEITKIDAKLKELISSYKFSIFIRFWLQNHLIIGVYSLINLKSVNLNRIRKFIKNHFFTYFYQQYYK